MRTPDFRSRGPRSPFFPYYAERLFFFFATPPRVDCGFFFFTHDDAGLILEPEVPLCLSSPHPFSRADRFLFFSAAPALKVKCFWRHAGRLFFFLFEWTTTQIMSFRVVGRRAPSPPLLDSVEPGAALNPPFPAGATKGSQRKEKRAFLAGQSPTPPKKTPPQKTPPKKKIPTKKKNKLPTNNQKPPKTKISTKNPDQKKTTNHTQPTTPPPKNPSPPKHTPKKKKTPTTPNTPPQKPPPQNPQTHPHPDIPDGASPPVEARKNAFFFLLCRAAARRSFPLNPRPGSSGRRGRPRSLASTLTLWVALLSFIPCNLRPKVLFFVGGAGNTFFPWRAQSRTTRALEITWFPDGPECTRSPFITSKSIFVSPSGVDLPFPPRGKGRAGPPKLLTIP